MILRPRSNVQISDEHHRLRKNLRGGNTRGLEMLPTELQRVAIAIVHIGPADNAGAELLLRVSGLAFPVRAMGGERR